MEQHEQRDAAQSLRAQYRMKGAYDPYYIRVRVRPLSPAKSLALYLWTMLWLGAVMFSWMWAATPLVQILPDTR